MYCRKALTIAILIGLPAKKCLASVCNKKTCRLVQALKIYIPGIVVGWIIGLPFYRLVFIGIISYLQVLNLKKKKLTDIELLIFYWIWIGSFRGYWIFWLMFVEHQSTSGTKIYNPGACARGLPLNYSGTENTVAIVIIRNYDASISPIHVVFKLSHQNIWTFGKCLSKWA